MLWETIFGTAAVVFLVVSFAPQVIKSWQTKSVGDISWLMLIIHALANVSWLGYGYVIMDPVILIADAIVLLFVLILIGMKVKYSTENLGVLFWRK